MDNFIDLSPEQLDQFNSVTDGGRSNFANGYRYLYSIVGNISRTGDPVRDRQLRDLRYWLRNAPDINENNPQSAANLYIRALTGAGLRWDGHYEEAEPANMQYTSNTIRRNVIGDVQKAHGIPPLEQLVGRDISQALSWGHQTLGGWGGSAY